MRLLDRWLYTWPLRLRSLSRRRQVDQELDEELRYHLQRQIQEQIARGLTPEQARTDALRAFGGVERRKEECRDTRRVNHIEDLWKDLRHTARALGRSPGFTAIAVLTLGLGIGATTAIFSVVNGVLLKPLPFHESERLVSLRHRAPGIDVDRVGQGAATHFTYRDSNRVFEDVGAWGTAQVSLTGRGAPERVRALLVTDGTLPLLRVQPLLGRVFSQEDDAPGAPLRVVLTHGYWQHAFGGVRDVVGRLIEIDGRASEVIGVLPSSFRFLDVDPAVLLPMQLDRSRAFAGSFSFAAVARLKPGVTLAQANADVARMILLILERFPLPRGFGRDQFEGLRLEPNVQPLAEDLIGDAQRVLWTLLATVGAVLLIACANVANLFLIRAEGRHQELAIRAALGASRGRIARTLVAESMALAVAGGALGLLFAAAGIRVLASMAPAAVPRIDSIEIDPVVLLFTLATAVAAGLVLGFVPVLRLGTPRASALREGGRTASDEPRRHRARNLLVVSEVALALVLLIVSGLMVRTFLALQQVDPGFVRPLEVQTFRIAIPDELIADPEHVARTYQQIADRLRNVPGVALVGLSHSITMDGERASTPLFVEAEGAAVQRLSKWIGPGYFHAMGNHLVAGRSITWHDIFQRAHVAVVSENLAREHWKTPIDAIGKRVRSSREDPWREIVGVVGNERDEGLSQPAPTIVYWPLLMKEFWDPVFVNRTMAYAVRSDRVGSPGFLRELQQAVWSIHPSLPLADVRTLDEIQAGSIAQTSFAMVMLAIAASVALLLGVVGIYGVIAYIAAQRTREIGIRMAVGARTRDVRRLFLRQGLALTAAGIALGVLAALLVTRLMSALLFGVSAVDPVTYVVVAASLAVVALMATYLPARRASRVDPIIALRSEV